MFTHVTVCMCVYEIVIETQGKAWAEKKDKLETAEGWRRTEQSKENLCDGRRPLCSARVLNEKKPVCVCVCLCSSAGGSAPSKPYWCWMQSRQHQGQGKWLQGLLSDCSAGCTWGTALHSNTAAASHRPSHRIPESNPTGSTHNFTRHGPQLNYNVLDWGDF